jgi:hypothetical protein
VQRSTLYVDAPPVGADQLTVVPVEVVLLNDGVPGTFGSVVTSAPEE